MYDRGFYWVYHLNRWSERIPMSPVEGYDDVFQVVWNVTPGHHQVNSLF
jgi:hypothetical protein